MKVSKEVQDLLESQCKVLESAGFSIQHGWGNHIRCKIANEYSLDCDIELRCDSVNIIRDALIALYKKGSVYGQNQFRTSLTSLLNEEVL